MLLAPPDQPDIADLILRLSTGNWDGLNPALIALFNAMGLWPMVYAAVALVDGRGQRIWAWPFVGASFAVGAFALLPYLALRSPVPWVGPEDRLLRVVGSRLLGASLALAALVLLGWGLIYGDWSAFWQQWQTSRFVHVMTLDFCALWLLFPVLLIDDLPRRGLRQGWVIPSVLALPLLGAALYLALRPPLPRDQSSQAPTLAPVPESSGLG
ncbi:DUF2834 domain-containing protein [Leptolyngbya sp. BL0902]|nr:DUF2834 domain-containing protein [Leptolyngbya sp. BL0902]